MNNMSYDSNDDEYNLTKEYKYLLSSIRPLIDQLDKSKDAQLCLLWLSKLEQCGKWERKYRNKILSELCKQVKGNHLKSPFSSPPPHGPLRYIITGNNRVTEWNVNDFSEDVSTETELSSSTFQSNCSFNTSNKIKTSASPWKGDYLHSNSRNRGSTKPPREEVDHSECFAIQKAYQERAQSDQLVIEKYQDIIKSLVSQQSKADISPSRLKKLQSISESKITELVHSLKKAQDENDMLKRKLSSITHNMNEIENIKNENEDLKQEIKNVTAAKNSLDLKYKEAEEEKLMTFTDLMNKLNEAEKKLRESEKRYKLLEKRYEENHCNCETEHLAQKSEMVKKYAADLMEMEKLLELKNSEIIDLKEQINNQCVQFEVEVSRLRQEFMENSSFVKDKKIKILKNKTRKLEKLREHMALLFHSQLQQIIAKKDFYIATLEMQLKMHNSELESSNVGSDLHNALIQKVLTLESQYRKLLEESEKQSIIRRQQDLQKIHNLEKQLLLYGGVVEDAESTLNCLQSKSLPSVTAIDEDPKADSLP